MAYLTGSQCNNWGSLASNLNLEFRHFHQEVTQGVSGCEVADEPVVVMKSRPVNAGNRWEDKTEMMTSGDLVRADSIKSAVQNVKGGSNHEVL